MTRFFTIFSVLLTIVSLVSCKSSITKASETVAAFASGVATSDSVTAVKYYPATKDFYSLLPHIGEIEITEAKEVDDNIVIVGQSSYYDKKSVFIQQNLTFWVKKAENGFVIFDSKGLLELPKELKDFPYRVGAIDKHSKDVTIGKYYNRIIGFFYYECFKKSNLLNSGIKKISWSWEADWGTPNGNCTIKNELPFTVKDVKYKITYFNGDDIVGSDDGTAAYSLDSGSLKSFTFYSSGVNGYRARTARIEFEVPERFAIEWVLNENYEGNEFKKYIED